MDNERIIVPAFNYQKYTQAIVSKANPVAVIDTVPVQAGSFWHVERANLQFQELQAAAPALGDMIGLYLCPPGTPASIQTTNGGPAQTEGQITDEPIVIEEMDIVEAQIAPASNGVVITAGGAGSWLIGLRTLRPFYVPSLWFMRAAVNLSGDAGGPGAASLLTFSYMYAQLKNC